MQNRERAHYARSVFPFIKKTKKLRGASIALGGGGGGGMAAPNSPMADSGVDPDMVREVSHKLQLVGYIYRLKSKA